MMDLPSRKAGGKVAVPPVFIRDDSAQFYFEQTDAGQLLLFPVNFGKENGVWKISQF